MLNESDDILKDVSNISFEQQIADKFIQVLTCKIKRKDTTTNQKRVVKKIISDIYEIEHTRLYKMLTFKEQQDRSYLVQLSDKYIDKIKKELGIETDFEL